MKKSSSAIISIALLTLIVLAIATIFLLTQKNGGGANGLIAPQNVRADGNILKWDDVRDSNGYRVYVGDSKDFFTSTGANKLILNNMSSGKNYTFSIVAVDNKGMSSGNLSKPVTMTYKDTEDPTKPTLDSSDLKEGANSHVKWDSVPHAEGYSIRVDGFDNAQVFTTDFDLSHLSEGLHTVTVQALGNGQDYTNSFWSEPFNFFQEPKSGPDGGNQGIGTPYIVINANLVSWQAVANATGYEVDINGGQIAQVFTQILLQNPGTHVVKVRALNGITPGDWSNTITYAKEGEDNSGGGTNSGSLSAPHILFLNGKVNWDPVSGATAYDVYVDEDINTQSHVNYEYSELEKSGPGTRFVKVRARKGNEISGWSNTCRPTVNIMQPKVTVSGSKVSWEPIEGASYYEVFVNRKLIKVDGPTSYDISSHGEGTYTFSLRVYSSKYKQLSMESDEVTVVVGTQPSSLNKPSLRLDYDCLGSNIWFSYKCVKWSSVAGATGYEVSVNGNTVVTNDPHIIYWADKLSGTNTVKVRAKNSNGTGDWSEITVADSGEGSLKPPVLCVSVSNTGYQCLSWNKNPDADGYEIDANGTIHKTSESVWAPATHGSYTVKARAYNNKGDTSVWSSSMTVGL
ncbi:MAG: hypothetical protein LBU60_06270 [Clostridiales bacterium]|jgi:hypothetical protein|nr:hypothetical protein [Clostridiales bacterium]